MILFLLIMKFVMRRIVPYTLIDGFWKADVTAFLKIFLFPFFCLTLVEHPTRNEMETLRKVIRFYVEGFREMTVGRTLWAIILIKLFILFAVLKVFFFPDLLAGKSPSEKAGCVLENLTPEIPQP